MLKAASSGRRFEPRLVHVLVIVLATIAFLAPTLDNYWIKDDLAVRYFTEGNELAWEKVKTIFWPDHLEREHWWRPIPFLTIFADFEVWFTNPFGYHVFNTLLHALVGILVYLVVNRLTNFGNGLAGFLAALAFVINPINGESVIWAVQRIVPICAAACLFGILGWLKAAEGGGRGGRILGYLMLFFAIFTKEVGCTLPGIYFLIDMLYAPPGRGFMARLMSGVRWAIPSAILLVFYFACRRIMWGRFDILYAGMEPMEYAEAFQVFERMGDSLTHAFVPVNASLFEGWRYTLVAGLILTAYGIAAVRALPLLALSAPFRRLTIIACAFFALSFVPSMPIFWIDQNLFNARFFYQPSMASLMLVGAALWLPLGDRPLGRLGTAVATLGTVTLLSGLGVAMGLHVTAFEGAGEQVRGIQQSIARFADEEEKRTGTLPVVVALDTPSQVSGVPTLETSLEHALVRPLHHRDVEVIALTDTLRNTAAWTDYLSQRLGDRGTTRLSFVNCRRTPPSIEPVFGTMQGPEGKRPAKLIAPVDNAWFRNDAPSPQFRFRGGGARRFVLVVDVAGRPEPIRIHLEAGKNCRISEGVVQYDFGGRDASNPAAPDLWETAVRVPQPNPVSATWRIESYTDDDRLLGTSEERGIIVFNVL